jgi:hypothetical protein
MGSSHEADPRARRLVRQVHRELVAGGYDGPEPVFGDRWRTLFLRLATIIGPRVPAAAEWAVT